jgi:hypothetical protein
MPGGAPGGAGAASGGAGAASGGAGGVFGGSALSGVAAGTAGGAGLADRADRAWRIAAGIAALVLLAVPAVRAAVWLDALCVLAALAVGSYALAGGRSFAGIGTGMMAVPATVPAGTGMVARASAGAGSGGRWRLVAATGVGLLLVLLFGVMFRAADPRFDRLAEDWTGNLSAGTVARLLFGFVVAAGVAAGAAYTVAGRGAHGVPTEETAPHGARLRTAEWAVPLAMLVALFATFVWTQLGTLFGGRAHVMDPAGPDFADYARTGFLLLFVVTALALGVVTALSRLAGRATRRDRVLLRWLGGALCGLTLVIVVSALERMHLYVGAYGFSTPRLLAYALEVWLGLLFVIVLGAGWRLRAGWLPRAVTAAAVLVLIGVAAANPEALMARTHMDRLEHGYPVDTAFLDGLSADAAAEVAKAPWSADFCHRAFEPPPPDPWYRFNLSRYHARTIDRDLLC